MPMSTPCSLVAEAKSFAHATVVRHATRRAGSVRTAHEGITRSMTHFRALTKARAVGRRRARTYTHTYTTPSTCDLISKASVA